jgi:hypothetical protein
MTKNPTIQEQVSLLVDEAYTEGLVNGRREVIDAIIETLTKYEDAPTARRKPRTQPKSRRRRTLTTREQQMLNHITAHPGATSADLRAAGFRSIAPAYTLVKRRLIRQERATSPHAPKNGPWVSFYPPASLETPNGSA